MPSHKAHKEKVVVTGAAGFIGSNLCRMLTEHSYDVIAIDDLSAGTLDNLPSGVDFRKIDVCDPGLEKHLEGASATFHLAAKNCLVDCVARPVETARINVLGTANIINACVTAKVPHFIYADTSAEYEGVEEFPSVIGRVKPLSIYACSKRGGALLAGSFPQYYPINVTTVRYFNVYGPAQDWRRVIPPVMSAFTIRLLEKKQPLIYGTGEKRRDFIHVDDVNRFHILLLKKDSLRGGTYNLGSGKDYSVLEIFDMVESEIRSGIRPEFREELPGEAFRTQADLTESTAAGWKPEIGIREGISSFIKYTRERLEASPAV